MSDLLPENDLVTRMLGRAQFLRDRGEIKTPGTLEIAAARIRELEAALKPFAKAADKADRFIESAKRLGMGPLSESASIGHGLRYRHLFAARKALGGDNG